MVSECRRSVVWREEEGLERLDGNEEKAQDFFGEELVRGIEEVRYLIRPGRKKGEKEEKNNRENGGKSEMV